MGHSHHHHHHGQSSRNISIAFALNAIFVIIEIVGGLLTGSIAILSDALHDLGDTLSLGMAWYFERLSKKERDQTFSYGYGRFSLLSALISSIILCIGSIYIISETIPRFWNPQVPHGWGMFGLALLGVSINLIAAFRLSRGNTMNEKVLTWHLVEDAAGWVAVLIGSLLILWKGWSWVDPAIALVLSCYILWNVWKNLIATIKLFLQSIPEDFNRDDFTKKILAVEGVQNIHDLHIWSIDGHQHILSLHVEIEENEFSKQAMRVRQEVRQIVKNMGHYHLTLEIEHPDEFCHDTC